jgi:hypothetical protein
MSGDQRGDWAETFNATAGEMVVVAVRGGVAQLRFPDRRDALPIEITDDLLVSMSMARDRRRSLNWNLWMDVPGREGAERFEIEPRRLDGLIELMERARRAAEGE